MSHTGARAHAASGVCDVLPSSLFLRQCQLSGKCSPVLSLPFSPLASVTFDSASFTSTPWPCLFLSFLSLFPPSPSLSLSTPPQPYSLPLFRCDSHREIRGGSDLTGPPHFMGGERGAQMVEPHAHIFTAAGNGVSPIGLGCPGPSPALCPTHTPYFTGSPGPCPFA